MRRFCAMCWEPLRWSWTPMPWQPASKSLATLSELESASEVYQTTLPSLRAASTRASWADAGIAASTSVNANAPTRRVFMVRSSRCESLHEAVEARGGAERAHAPDHARGLLARHDEAGVPAELRLELLSRHRKLGAAPRMILTLLEPPSVAELDRDVADELPWVVDGGVELVTHPGCDAEDLGVAHGLVLELGEAGTPPDEDHGEKIGQAELRRVPVRRRALRSERLPEALHRPGRGPAADLGDLVGSEPVALPEAARAVHVGVGDRATGVGLEREPLELPHPAEAPKERLQALDVEAAREGAIESVLTLEDRLRPREAGAREQGRDDAGVGRPAGVEPLGPCAIGQVLDDATGLAPAHPEGVNELVLRRSVELPGDGRRAEGPDKSGRVVVAGVELPGNGEADAAHHLDARDHGREHGGPGRAERLAGGQARRHRHRARVDDRVLARLVGVEPVCERGVRQDGVGRGDPRLAADECALLMSAQALGRLERGPAEVVACGGEGATERVEDQRGRLRHDGRGNVLPS